MILLNSYGMLLSLSGKWGEDSQNGQTLKALVPEDMYHWTYKYNKK